ncbi:hypothetical protein [Paremcibacter congregatus]|uniref:hypothetical protein n=1 Tax=Paremcibacter congregatus TaxID=2043170 RepID=UPI003A8FAA6B
MNEKKFLKLWLSFAALLFCGIMGFNYVIDPYLLYGHHDLKGLNRIKPKAGTHSLQSKIHAAHRMAPDALIIGNSRPEMGLNPAHSYFIDHNLQAFNLGQPGSGLSVQYGYALDILRDHDIKQVLISVDFLDFVTSADSTTDPRTWPPAPSDADKRRKYHWDGTENNAYFLQSLKDRYFPLIALSTFWDSLTTVANQTPSSSNLLANGFNPAGDMRHATTHEGVKALFGQKIPQVYNSFTMRKWQTDTPGYTGSPDLSKLQFLLRYLNNHNIETKVFINPYHINYLDIIDQAGLTSEFWLWKKRLVTLVAQTSTKDTITLWDFSDPTDYIAEPILKAGRTPLKWFWEPAHYSQALGDLMLDRMLGKPGTGPKDFGHPLTMENFARHQAAYKNKLEAYHQRDPEEYSHLTAQLPKREKD